VNAKKFLGCKHVAQVCQRKSFKLIAYPDDLDDKTSIAGNSVLQDIIVQELAHWSLERLSFN